MPMNSATYHRDIELLTLVTAGSVDDGKSTLIGRLLFDVGALYEDQIESVRRADRVEGEMDFSLFTDGLSAEREQKITIDVAYRYFATNKRRFIIADVPGHEQYTRNMVTGASKARVALILIDVRKGLSEQTKRHLFIASLLGIPHVAMVINKMDMVGYDEIIFEQVKKSCQHYLGKLKLSDIQYIPASSLKGDMIVERGNNLSWYQGWTVLDYLENVELATNQNLIDFRLPIQYVIRPHQDFRGYAGTVASGTIKIGEPVTIVPSGQTTTIKEIIVAGKSSDEAFSPQSIMVTLSEHVDASRGDMIVRSNNVPDVSQEIEVMMSWFDAEPLVIGKRYWLKHTTRQVPVFADTIHYAIDINSLHRQSKTNLEINDVGRVTLKTQAPLAFDAYGKNKTTGSFIIIDEISNTTAGAGIIIGRGEKKIYTDHFARAAKKNGGVVWFTGLSGSGKTTIAKEIFSWLQEKGIETEYLDGDVLRETITADAGYTRDGRIRNLETAAFVADRLSAHGVIVVAAFISPYAEQREKFKKNIKNFTEIYVNAPIDVCEERDVKGLYKKARAGEVQNFTGISQDYEPPRNPDVELKTGEESVSESVEKVTSFLLSKFNL